MMNSFKKILPNLLVISSTLCLVVFLAIWNFRQYEQAESSLTKELSFHLESAINEVHKEQLNVFMERLDVKVNPASKSSFFKGIGNDSSTKIVVWVDSLNAAPKERFHLQSKRNKFKFPSKVHPSDSILGKTEIYRFPETKSDSSSASSQGLSGLDLFTRENSVKNFEVGVKVMDILREKLIENDLPQNFYYRDSKSLTAEDQQKLRIPYKFPSLFVEPSFFYFHNHKEYLATKIIYPLAFSVFLLLLVLVAFAVLLRGWKQQARVVEMKNDFISNMTHELKTPISTVSVAIEAIRKYDVIKDKAKTEEYLDISSSELGRLSLLVEKVLRTTLFESGKGFLNPQPVDLSVIVSDTLRTMQMHFEERKVNLHTELLDAPLWVMGDKIHLTNVVYNLLENAIKYSGEQIEISVITKKIDGKAMLSISDKGIGIPLEHQKQIFTKFYRVPNHDRHNVKGHGLGLSYVKQVIDELNGTIELNSQSGKGSSFIIQLKTVKV